MRKLGRIVRRVLTAVSLLLLVAVLVAWVRGYSEQLLVEYQITEPGQWHEKWMRVEWGDGEIMVAWGHEGGLNYLTQRVKVGGQWYARIDRRTAIPIKQSLSGQGVLAKWSWDHGGVLLFSSDALAAKANRRSHWCHQMGAVFPCWIAAVVFGTLPFSWRGLVYWWLRYRRRRALASGRCGVCGYDLRASPVRCPECGTAVEARETPGGGAV